MIAAAETDIFKIQRNLSDAGFTPSLIQKFLSLSQQKKRKEQYLLLARHRAELLEELHHTQYKIDCLDYMVYAMKKEDKPTDEHV